MSTRTVTRTRKPPTNPFAATLSTKPDHVWPTRPGEYSVSNSETRGNGNVHSHVATAGNVMIDIPADANECQNPETGEVYMAFKIGPNILAQVYGPSAIAGSKAVFSVEIREKQLAKNKGGYKFLYLKCLPADGPATNRLEVTDRTGLMEAIDKEDGDITIVACPQMKHEGGIVVTPLPPQ